MRRLRLVKRKFSLRQCRYPLRLLELVNSLSWSKDSSYRSSFDGEECFEIRRLKQEDRYSGDIQVFFRLNDFKFQVSDRPPTCNCYVLLQAQRGGVDSTWDGRCSRACIGVCSKMVAESVLIFKIGKQELRVLSERAWITIHYKSHAVVNLFTDTTNIITFSFFSWL